MLILNSQSCGLRRGRLWLEAIRISIQLSKRSHVIRARNGDNPVKACTYIYVV
jgi:hypothetical protein